MKYNKTENAKRNLTFGLILQMLNVLLPYIQRIVINIHLGTLYLGLSSLFTSILGMLSLAELGFSSAMVFSMYKPIAENNIPKVREILAYYRKVYFVIGVVISILGIIVTPFITYLIDGEYPSDVNIYIVYLILLANTSCSYFVFAYKNALISAFQRTDLRAKAESILITIRSVFQIAVIILFKNYYVYIAFGPVFTLATNVLISKLVDKHYPDYYPEGKLQPEEKNQIKDNVKSLFVYKIGTVIAGFADNVVISSFLGLVVLAQYNNYYTILTALFSALQILYGSIMGGFGNSIASDTVSNNYKLFNKIFWVQSVVVGWMTTCLLVLFQPFITLSYGEKLKLPLGVVICIVLLFYCWKINDINHIFKEAAGLWKYDRFRPFCAAIINFSINIISVRYIGLYGVVLSSLIIEVTISLFWGCRIIYKYYFKEKFSNYLKQYLLYGFINAFICASSYIISSIVTGNALFVLIVRAAICIVIPMVLYFAIYNLIGKKEYIQFLYTRIVPKRFLNRKGE